MIRQSLFRQRFPLTVLRLIAFNLRQFNSRKEGKWSQMHRRHSCILFHKPVQCFETINKHWYSDDPSCIRINLPALSPTMETGTIVKWYKKEGEKVNEGDVLVDIETDKATIAFESTHEGYLVKILIPEGTKNVPVGQLLCVIVENEADIGKLKEECYVQAPAAEVTSAVPAQPSAAAAAADPAQPSAAAEPAQPPTTPTPAEPSPSNDPLSSVKRVFASPLALKQAIEKGLDLKTVAPGTGIWSSIKTGDLLKAGSEAIAAVSKAVHGELPVPFKANAITMELANSKKIVPHYYLIADVKVNKIFELCEKFNETPKSELNLGIKDFIFKAAALSCIAVPETNSIWMDTLIREYKSVNINIAMYLPSGLVMPVLHDTEKRTLLDINKNVNILIQKAKEEKLEDKDIEVGTFTVTYLGMYNILTFIPIVRPPQSCALAVGACERRAAPNMITSNSYEVDDIVTVTLSCDHRVVDGAKGAQWLKNFKQLLEDPHSMLL